MTSGRVRNCDERLPDVRGTATVGVPEESGNIEPVLLSSSAALPEGSI